MAVACILAGCGKKVQPRDFMKENVDRWRGELARWGGDWPDWEKKVAPFRQDVRKALDERPGKIAGIVGLDGYLFFRRSLEVLVAGDLRAQTDGRDPYPAIVGYHRQLRQRGVELLFCPIPVKAAVLPEKISRSAPGPEGPWVDPWTRKLMLDLAEAGVECVDLLPEFLAARREGADTLYMPLDTHWTPVGLELAARVLAERIKACPWYADAAKDPAAYATKDVAFRRQGDIKPMLPEAERAAYRPLDLAARQVVMPDGRMYQDDKTSPVLFLGDSYAGLFHFGECEHAGVTAHIAKEIGMPVDLVLGLGMGPQVWKKLAYRGKTCLAGKKLVVWALSERDLFGYATGWEAIPLP